MKNLLKFEFHKLVRQKSFYICTIVMLALTFISLLITKTWAESDLENAKELSGAATVLTAVSSSSFTMLSGIFIALFACNDYDSQTIKNVYAHGFSRGKVYFSKLLTTLAAVVVMFAVMLVFSYVSGSALFGNESAAGNYIGLIFGQLILCLAYAAFVFAVSLVIKKTGASVALAILGTSLVGTVLNLGDAMLKSETFKLSSYWLDAFMTDLTTLTTDTSRLTLCMVLSVIYAAVFVFAGYSIQKKQES